MLFDVNNRKPLLSQSDQFEQWIRSGTKSVLINARLHEDQAQWHPETELQSLTDTMQGIDEIVEQNRMHELATEG